MAHAQNPVISASAIQCEVDWVAAQQIAESGQRVRLLENVGSVLRPQKNG
jgi:hypothetical protein